jgi:hypothetical protein
MDWPRLLAYITGTVDFHFGLLFLQHSKSVASYVFRITAGGYPT